jgi:hypothetical protein
MAERLVDVLDGNNVVLHTYPISIEAADIIPDETEYFARALEAAAHAQLVSDANLKSLSARMHVSRRGPLAPYGDTRGTLSETKRGLEQLVRERAYFLWENDGCPHGRADDYWQKAHDEHLQGRAYVLWQQEGSPEGQADEQWHQSRQSEMP